MSAEHGLTSDPPTGPGGRAQDHVHIAADGACGARQLGGPAHLPQDLRLTEYLGVEPRNHGEQVTDGGGAVEAVERPGDIRPALPRYVTEPRFEVVVAAPVELGAVAGGENQRGAA